MKEIILIGGYQPTDQLTRFINEMQQEYKILVRYYNREDMISLALTAHITVTMTYFISAPFRSQTYLFM